MDMEPIDLIDSETSLPFTSGRFSPAILKSSRPEIQLPPDIQNTTINEEVSSNNNYSRGFAPRRRLKGEAFDNSSDLEEFNIENTNELQCTNSNFTETFSENDEMFEENLDYDLLNRNTLNKTECEDWHIFQADSNENDTSPRLSSPSKKVTFRCEENLVEILEIPSRHDIYDNDEATGDSFINNNNHKNSLIHVPNSTGHPARAAHSARPRLNNVNLQPLVLLQKRPKTSNSRSLNEKNAFRNKLSKNYNDLKPLKNNALSRGKSKSFSCLSVPSNNANSSNFPKIKNNGNQLNSINSNSLLSINSKRLYHRSNLNTQQTSATTEPSSSLPQVPDLQTIRERFKASEEDTTNNRGDDNPTTMLPKYMISKERMLAWHVANSTDLSEIRSAPQIVPMWE